MRIEKTRMQNFWFSSPKTPFEKPNTIFREEFLILYKGLIKSSMNRSLRIWSNPYIKSKPLHGKKCLGFRRDFLVMKIKYFPSGFFLFARYFSQGIQKSYSEHRAGIIKMRKMKAKKVLWKTKDIYRYSPPTLDPETMYSGPVLPIRGIPRKNAPPFEKRPPC